MLERKRKFKLAFKTKFRVSVVHLNFAQWQYFKNIQAYTAHPEYIHINSLYDVASSYSGFQYSLPEPNGKNSANLSFKDLLF